MMPLKVWQNDLHWKGPVWLLALGAVSLMAYAFARVLFDSSIKPVELTLALSGLIAFSVWGGYLRRSVILLLGMTILVQLIAWGMGRLDHPEWTKLYPDVDRLAKLFIFISIAWWLRGSTRNTLLIWGLAVVGFLITTLLAPGGDGWAAGFTGERVGFGVRNKQHASMFFGVICLGLTVFAPRCFMPGPWRAARILAWSLAMAITVAGIAVGQTRAIWLGLTVALATGLLLWSARVVLAQGARRLVKPLALIVILLVLIGGILDFLLGDSIHHRFNKENAVISQVLEGDVSGVPYTSVGIRIHSWVAATDWITERPMVGWGSEGRSLVMDETEWLPEKISQKFGHLHNFFLEIWVGYGLLGVAVIAALAIWIGRATWLAWRGGAMPGDMALFGSVFFVFWMIVNQFESYNSFWTGVFVHNLIVGGLVSHYWHWRTEQEEGAKLAEV